MKVYISKYRDHWLSPYKIAEKLCFWREIDYDEAWVRRLNKMLEPVMTGIRWVLDKVHPRIEYVKIDRYDVWSMDITLALIILPMLKQLKATKHGYPSNLTEKKWEIILDKMIWSFEQVVLFYEDSQFWIVKPEIDWEAKERSSVTGLSEIKWKVKGKLDTRRMKRHHQKIDEGLELFGKYYRNLWD